MKYILPKPDIRYFDEGLNSQIESHSHAQLRIEVAKARADEREACTKECKKLLKVFLSPQYSTGQPLSSFKERHAVAACMESIRARGAK